MVCEGKHTSQSAVCVRRGFESDSNTDELGILVRTGGCPSFCSPAELKAAEDDGTTSWKQLEGAENGIESRNSI